jgi:anaerobic dimethyl sulfoxide reductase subunit C
MLKEWPLVAFTILGQAAVGLFVVGLIPLVFLSDVLAGGRSYLLTLFRVVFCLMAIATLVSFLHLHHPLRAVRALANVRTSWLSREILFGLIFAALVAAECVLVTAGGTLRLVRLVVLFAGLAGLLYLVSMIKVYMLGSIPFWNQAGTPLLFASTSLSLGALAAGGISGGLWYFFLAMILVLVDLTLAFFLAPGCGLLIGRDEPSLRPPAARSGILNGAGLGLEAAGLISMAAVSLTPLGDRLMRESLPFWNQYAGIVVLALFSLTVLGAQVIRRFAFYALWGRTNSNSR